MSFFSRFFSPKKYFQPPYDFFISYKAEDATIVRQFAEQLVASGLSVWFAEYLVLLSGRSDPEVKQAIDDGIQQSKYGICFTNNRYIQSPWCRDELEQLLKKFAPVLRKVIEIQLSAYPSPHQKYPELAQSSSIQFSNVNQGLRFIRDASGLPIVITDSEESKNHFPSIFYYNNREYSLDLTGWEIDRQKSSILDEDVFGPKFQRWFGKYLFWGHLIIGKQDKHILRKKLGEGYKSDREYYDNAITFAEYSLEKRFKQECLGVHLLFMHNYSHNVFTTYWSKTWSRLYSIVLPDLDGEDAEFTFIFFYRESFADFCRYAHYMDKIVQSLTWRVK